MSILDEIHILFNYHEQAFIRELWTKMESQQKIAITHQAICYIYGNLSPVRLKAKIEEHTDYYVYDILRYTTCEEISQGPSGMIHPHLLLCDLIVSLNDGIGHLSFKKKLNSLLRTENSSTHTVKEEDADYHEFLFECNDDMSTECNELPFDALKLF